MHTREVLLGQNSVARPPDSAQTVTATCLSHTSVGTVSLGEYSVYTALPLGSALHTPDTASLPDLRQIWAVSTPLGNRKARIRQALVNPLHDIAPDILVEGCAPVVAQQLVVIAAAPDPRRIVGGKAHKPDVPVVCGGSALARSDMLERAARVLVELIGDTPERMYFFVGFQGSAIASVRRNAEESLSTCRVSGSLSMRVFRCGPKSL